MSKKIRRVKVLEGSPMIMKDDTIYDVESLPYDLTTLNKGSMYMFDGGVMLYQGDIKKPSQCNDTGFYTIDHSEIITHINEGDSPMSIDDVVSYDVPEMLQKLSEIDIDDQLDITTISDKNKPVINDDDSGFDKVIKAVIIEKGISPKSYSKKFAKEHTIGNYISALRSDKDMSTKYFMNWIEVLGLDYKLIVSDNGTDQIPLDTAFQYDSRTGEITEIESN